MTSVNTYHLQTMKDCVETGNITTVDALGHEDRVANALGRVLDDPGVHDLIKKLITEIASFRDKAADCESLLAEFKTYTEAVKQEKDSLLQYARKLEDTAEQQLKGCARTICAKATPKRNVTAPTPSPIDPTLLPAPSRTAVISFPGGPRTITIHPPGSPNYQSIIRDEKGDVIIDFKSINPLRREGAFRGSLDDIDWHKIAKVYGRVPEPKGPRSAPPIPHWPDRSQPPPPPPPSPSRGASDIIARQRQLSFSMQTDKFGRLLDRDHHPIKAESPCCPSDPSSASESASHDTSGSEPESVSTPASTPPSPSDGKGKKRVHVDEEENVPSTPKSGDIDSEGTPLTAKDPATPAPAPKHSESDEGPSKRKKRRSGEVTLVGGNRSRAGSVRDSTRPN